MGSDNTNRRTVETEFKKAMVRVNVPVGLLVTAFGIGLMVHFLATFSIYSTSFSEFS